MPDPTPAPAAAKPAAAAASAVKGMSPFAVPILIIFFAAAISVGAGMMYGEKRSIEWMIALFLKISVPSLLIMWASRKIREG